MTVREHVMRATGTAVEKLEQVESLAVKAGLRIHAMVGNGHQHGLSGQRASLDGGPDPADQGVDTLQRQPLGGEIGGGVRRVIEVAGEIVEELDRGGGKLGDQFSLSLS